MPRKSDPATAVLAYFESAPIDAADLVLTLSRAVMVRRHGTLAKPKKAKTPGQRSTPPPPINTGAEFDPGPTPPPSRARTRKPKDQALPGIQGPGPVAEVGG